MTFQKSTFVIFQSPWKVINLYPTYILPHGNLLLQNPSFGGKFPKTTSVLQIVHPVEMRATHSCHHSPVFSGCIRLQLANSHPKTLKETAHNGPNGGFLLSFEVKIHLLIQNIENRSSGFSMINYFYTPEDYHGT